MKFTDIDLKNMIVPLFLEQLLLLLVGIVDILIVSYVNESAVSGVSLVNMINTFFIYLFTALASGGAVIISQYTGKLNKDQANEAASQLLVLSTIVSFMFANIVIVFNNYILKLMFGSVEPAVMEAAVIYFRISAYSYPAIAIYNAGAALYKCMGRTAVLMKISLIANILNVIGNMIGVFVLHAGVESIAYASLTSRLFSAIIITYFCFNSKNEILYQKQWILLWRQKIIFKILNIAIPNSVEKGLFQLMKIVLGSIVTLFGTHQIAANGIAQSIWSLAAIGGIAMNPVYITVIGQCMGGNDIESAEYYFKKLLKISFSISIVWNMMILVLTPIILRFYALETETKILIVQLVLIHNLFNACVFPFCALSNGLRAVGDVKYITVVSIIATVLVRVSLSILFAVIMNWGVIGIAFAMCCDWMIQSIFYVMRIRSGQWKTFKII